MTLLELIEDAFLDALEEGANPPAEFTIHLPWEAWLAVGSPAHQVAGFTIFFRGDDRAARAPLTRH